MLLFFYINFIFEYTIDITIEILSYIDYTQIKYISTSVNTTHTFTLYNINMFLIT